MFLIIAHFLCVTHRNSDFPSNINNQKQNKTKPKYPLFSLLSLVHVLLSTYLFSNCIFNTGPVTSSTF